MNDNETYSFEGRTYVDPAVSLEEKNAFIDNLRNAERQRTEQIATDTYDLGTRVPSGTGGLNSGSGYFASRYQTPAVNSTLANLRAAAQADALQQYYNNWRAQASKRYEDAQRAYRRRSRSSSGGSGNSGYTIPYTETPEGEGVVTLVPTDDSYTTNAAEELNSITTGAISDAAEKQAQEVSEKLKQVYLGNDGTVKTPQEAYEYWRNIKR